MFQKPRHEHAGGEQEVDHHDHANNDGEYGRGPHCAPRGSCLAQDEGFGIIKAGIELYSGVRICDKVLVGPDTKLVGESQHRIRLGDGRLEVAVSVGMAVKVVTLTASTVR